jgi:hypothetical protein
MDSIFAIKPPPGVGQSRAVRDPVAVRGAVDTELVGDQTVKASAERGGKDHGAKHDDGHHAKDADGRADHAPPDLVADPNARDVIYRERDVRASGGEHPDHALLRQRAYRPAMSDSEPLPSDDPHADIRA